MHIECENLFFYADCTKSKRAVYIKCQNAYKPIYFFSVLLYNEIMNKCDFEFMFSSWQCGES